MSGNKQTPNCDAMESNNDDWKKFIANPEVIVEGEKKTWLILQGIIAELLDGLKANGKIETSFTQSELSYLKSLLKNRNSIGANYNFLMDVLVKQKTASFIQVLQEYGYEEKDFAYLLVGWAVLVIITDTESFKTLLLFHLKDVDHKASQFNVTIAKDAPNAWKKLKPYVYNKFRNALAHGTWTLEKGQIFLFEDAKLIPFEKLGYGSLLTKLWNKTDFSAAWQINSQRKYTLTFFAE